MILCLRYMSAIIFTAWTVPGEFNAGLIVGFHDFPPWPQITSITLPSVSW